VSRPRPISTSLLGVVDYLNLVHDYRATGDKSYLIQEFLPDARDYRAMVVDGAYVARRASGNPPDAVEEGGGNTTSTAARRPPVSTSRTRARELAERTAEALGIDYLGVDLLETDGRLVVNETNARPTVDAATKYKPDFYMTAGLIERTAAGEEKRRLRLLQIDRGGVVVAVEHDLQHAVVERRVRRVLVDRDGQFDGFVVLPPIGRRRDGERLPVALQGELILRDGREVGDESHAVVGGVRVHVRRRAEAGVLASGVPVGHLVHHPFDLLEEVAERIVTVVSIHTSREVADPDKPSVHDRLRRRSGSCRRYAATLSIGRHLRDPLG